MKPETRKRSILYCGQSRAKRKPAFEVPTPPPRLTALGNRAFELIYDWEDQGATQGRWTSLALRTMDYHFKRAVFTSRLAEVRNLGENHV